MRKGNHILLTNAIKNPIDGREECVGAFIMLGLNPFAFEYSPQGLCDIEVGRVWRQIHNVQIAILPFRYFGLNLFAFMETCIVQQKHCGLLQLRNETVNEFNEFIGVNILTRCESMIFIVPANHAEDIQSRGFLCWNCDFSIRELPSIRHIATCADMRLISEEEVYMPAIIKVFKFLQLLDKQIVEMRRGCPLRRKSYTLISCAKTPKKRFKVETDNFTLISFS